MLYVLKDSNPYPTVTTLLDRGDAPCFLAMLERPEGATEITLTMLRTDITEEWAKDIVTYLVAYQKVMSKKQPKVPIVVRGFAQCNVVSDVLAKVSDADREELKPSLRVKVFDLVGNKQVGDFRTVNVAYFKEAMTSRDVLKQYEQIITLLAD
ncbi:hypothetical protein [Burkholderia phage BCSR5]|nr:hypothetical protein [Burkholderia phage BCSR5]